VEYLKVHQLRLLPGVGACVVLAVERRWIQVQWLTGAHATRLIYGKDQAPSRPPGWDVGRPETFSGDRWIVLKAVQG
jgi:hypothetical protein